MVQPLIVTKNFNHLSQSAYSQLEKYIPFKKFELIHVTAAPHYVDPIGWFVPLASDQYQFQLSSHKIDEYYELGYFKTYDDLVLEKNYLHFKIDQALDHFSHIQFLEKVQELKEVDQMLGIMDEISKPIAQ
ncbi:hypothetical protein [Halobacillus massiliensis]|uniref:hypothetical protein n=1 Tax=Halobacillus massiliensis TaxID=1926286 RepID=UPI0009E23932|nr:hypothetical protein [Halobacillus massiliensis]